MTCAICGGKTKVIDSRSNEDSKRRRRECLECNYRFSTVEIDADYYEDLKPTNNQEIIERLDVCCKEFMTLACNVLKINNFNNGVEGQA